MNYNVPPDFMRTWKYGRWNCVIHILLLLLGSILASNALFIPVDDLARSCFPVGLLESSIVPYVLNQVYDVTFKAKYIL